MNGESGFEAVLRKQFPVIDHRGERIRPGRRVIYVSGLFMDDLEQFEQCIQEMKAQLPADARPVDGRADPLRDRYAMVFTSCEWEPIDEGGLIPELPARFAQDRDSEGRYKGIVPVYRLDAECTGYAVVYSYDRNRFRLEPIPEKCTEEREAFKLVLK